MSKNPHYLLILMSGLVALIIWVIYFIRKNRRNMRRYYETLEGLSKYFPGELSRSSKFLSDIPCFVGQFSGYKFTLTYVRIESAPPSSLQLKWYAKHKIEFKIFSYSKPMIVLFAKRVFIDDPTLDKYHLYSNMRDEALRYLRDESRKAAIKKLIEDGWSFPTINRNSISISADVNHLVTPEGLRATLEQLAVLRT
jgi:hypothetical protein